MFKDYQVKLYCIIKKRGGEFLAWKSIGWHPFHPYPWCDMIDCNRVVIKSRGPGIFPGYFYRKIEEK